MLRPSFRVAVTVPDYDFPDTPPERLLARLGEIAGNAERSGFEALFVMDHHEHSGEPGYEGHRLLEGPTTLAAVAAMTEQIQLGLMTGGVTYRNPALFAKITTTIDVLSGGRAIFGIGAGWLESEHVTYGFEFPTTRKRFELLEDQVRIARAMFTEENSQVEGTYTSTHGPLNRPRPIRGDIPILIGGNGEKKTLRFVAQYADACNVFGDPAEIKRLMGVLDRHCEDVGRDPSEIWRTYHEWVVIGETRTEAEEKLARLRAAVPVPEQYDTALVGSPDDIAEQHAKRLEAGADAIVASIRDLYDPTVLGLAGPALHRAIAQV